MANFLVTGAGGFIGSKLARRLIDEGHDVTTVDNLTTGFKENLPRGVRFIHGDLAEPSVINQLHGENFEAIFHIAGQSSGEVSFEDPIYDIRSNAESTLLLLKLCLEIACDRFIYASTMSVYGHQPSHPVTERDVCRPTSFYGVAKLASERYLDLYAQYGIRSTSLRLFNVYGTGQNLSNLKQGMVSIYLSQLLDHGRIEVKGAPDRFRDFIHVDDAVEAFSRCLNNGQAEGQAINIATGVATTVSDLLAMMVCGQEGKVPIEFLAMTPGDIHGIYADVSKMNDVLGAWDKVPLNAGIKALLADYERQLPFNIEP